MPPHNHGHLFSRQLPSCVKYTEHKNPPTSKCCSRVLNTLAMLCGCHQHLYSSSQARTVPVRHCHPVFLPPWLYFLTVISQVWVPPVTGVRAEPVLFQHPQCSPVLCTDERSPTLQTLCLFFICSQVCEHLGGLGSLATVSVTAVGTSMRAFASAFNFSSIDTEAEFLNYKVIPLNFCWPSELFYQTAVPHPKLSPLSETGGRVSPCSLPKALPHPGSFSVSL